MASKKRKRRSDGPRPPRKPAAVREAEARAQLEPLGAGERPKAVTVAALIAGALVIANVIATATSGDATSKDWQSTAAQSIVLVVCAVGMWKAKYWAVLGFQALLVLQILNLTQAVLLGDNLLGQAVFGLVVLGLGTLFYFLIKAMARLQMPQR